MPKNLCHSLDKLALMQIKHKAGCGELLDSFKRILYHILLIVPVYGYVVQVNDCGQRTITRHIAQDTFDH